VEGPGQQGFHCANDRRTVQPYVRPIGALYAAGHDEIYDADRLKRIATNGLIGIEISLLGFSAA
jgi:hypothetical protein